MCNTKAGAGYAEAPVYMEDGPHGEGAGQHRTSAALFQMTQRGDADWASAGVEFTPSVFTLSTPSATGMNASA
ncbi:hypothetical protein B0H19DRAFT_1260008 [Mycena capillaripes]|nr:hypothetical protein B0H19DRAFT_1260008 [Mycena capillaripes]